ncbi:MAG TPA: type II toxin-antitoxin system prevent-host-death family antitoxin [Thermoanaerobaculia bacterium]|nr:type II toxin-antitoxin system prevent-host-death family antitoxin [Thermoanaerobaculia bacterium]
MTISVTELKSRLLEIIRAVEREGKTVEIERHGRVVARLIPTTRAGTGRPWERLHGSGVLLAEPGESVLEESDFEATR